MSQIICIHSLATFKQIIILLLLAAAVVRVVVLSLLLLYLKRLRYNIKYE